MKIQTTEKTVNPHQGQTIVSLNPTREREMLDRNGNVIDPKTKRIIKPADNR